MSRAKEKIVVIGGGYAGTLSAIQLANTGLYDVTLIEAKDGIFRGTSRDAFRLHLGGEYPLDETMETGLNCLIGAMVFKQMFPEDVFTPVPPVNFYVAEETAQVGYLNIDKYTDYYERIKSKYEELLSENNFNPASFFGQVDEFYRLLEPDEFDHLAGVSAGFQSKEIGINPALVVKFITKALELTGVKIIYGHEVTDITRKPKTYEVEITKEGTQQTVVADQVVNASWQSAYWLDSKVAPQAAENKSVNIYLRSMLLVNIEALIGKHKENPSMLKKIRTPTFVMEGKHGGMWCPINDKLAAVYLPSEQGAYIDSAVLNSETPEMPSNWKDLMQRGVPDKKKRMANIIEELINIFPFLQDVTSSTLLTNPTLSYDAGELRKRRDIGVTSLELGYHTVTPTKATYAAKASLAILQQVLEHSVSNNYDIEKVASELLGFDINGTIPIRIPSHLSFEAIVRSKEALQENRTTEVIARSMGLPTEMAPTPDPLSSRIITQQMLMCVLASSDIPAETVQRIQEVLSGLAKGITCSSVKTTSGKSEHGSSIVFG